MKAIGSELPGVVLIEPTVFTDARGAFFESFNRRGFEALTGCAAEFVQDNHSTSVRNVLRGLHYQVHQSQGKLVRVVRGEVYDVAVDIRRSSPYFGRWAGVMLSSSNRYMRWIPPGFAHGFLVTSDSCEFLYKTTDYWAPEHERCIAWNDPDLAIDWQLDGTTPRVSAKDAQGLAFRDAEVFP